MNLKKQIAVIVLALTATTSLVWSQDRQTLASPNAQTLQGTWRVTRHGVNCITGEEFASFPAITTYNQGGTYTGYEVPPGERSRSGNRIRCLAARARPSELLVQRCELRLYAKGDFAVGAEVTEAYISPAPTASLVRARSRSSTLMGI